uniref:NADH dehydrogenase subunit 2 n=1 Tax=Tetrapedia diversipes TaxID=889126 RepID=UPI001EF9D959|nr:NADH dehydrogenase subunit 2 [Tetrapedia diversipes]UKG21053.1 NADH dehydrogenase subunit 2 [Tetrapedia diversipes]
MFILILSSLIFMIINNIYIKWFLIEINSIMTIMIINEKINKMPSIIYFFMSIFTSLLILMMLIMISFNYMPNYNYMFNFIIQMNLLAKLGIFPFHYWMINIYKMLSWNQIFYLSTWSKFIPLMFYWSITNLNNLTIFILLINMMFMSSWAFKLNNLKMIIACSSINQTSMLLLLLNFNFNTFIYYMIFYYISFYMLIKILNLFKLHNKFNLMMLNYNYKKIIMFMFIMYSMLPPSMFFIIKWLFFMNLLLTKMNLIMLFLMMISNIMMIWNYFLLMEKLMLKFNMKKYSNKKIIFKMLPIMMLMLNIISILFFYLI